MSGNHSIEMHEMAGSVFDVNSFDDHKGGFFIFDNNRNIWFFKKECVQIVEGSLEELK
jgi:hypothetical protein